MLQKRISGRNGDLVEIQEKLKVEFQNLALLFQEAGQKLQGQGFPPGYDLLKKAKQARKKYFYLLDEITRLGNGQLKGVKMHSLDDLGKVLERFPVLGESTVYYVIDKKTLYYYKLPEGESK